MRTGRPIGWYVIKLLLITWGGDNNRSGLVESIEGCEAGPRHRGEDQHYGGRPLQVSFSRDIRPLCLKIIYKVMISRSVIIKAWW